MENAASQTTRGVIRLRSTESAPGYVCDCLKLTAEDIRRAVRERNIRTLDELARLTEAGCGCTACRPHLARFLPGAQPSSPIISVK